VGALVFPVGFCILSLMGYDLVTGVFGLAPLAKFENRPGITWGRILRCWGLVGLGNLIGSLLVAFLIALTCFVRGILCNLMVCLGVIGNLSARTVAGKIAAMWLPIFIFFALVFEHAVVNMFLFPLGMMLGADFGIATWLNFNLIPTILGNIVGGLLFTCIPLYLTHAKTAPAIDVTEKQTEINAEQQPSFTRFADKK